MRLDLTGEKYGLLTVLIEDFSAKRRAWICECECGNRKSIQQVHLRSGATISCGCYLKQKNKERLVVHGKTRTPLHNIWKSMKQRCLNPNNRSYKNYGGRGITISEDWLEFENFYNWCNENGYERNVEMDRIDNSKGYFPSNIRFVTSKVNGRNRRVTAIVSVKGKNIALGELEEIFEKYNITIPSIRYKTTVKLRELYNCAKTTFGEVKLETIISYETYMKIPSQAFEEIEGRCND